MILVKFFGHCVPTKNWRVLVTFAFGMRIVEDSNKSSYIVQDTYKSV